MRPMVVHKYTLGPVQNLVQALTGPVRLVALDPSGAPCVWIEGTEHITRPRRFDLVGTGRAEITERHAHVGSVVQGPFVWHVYEVTR